jgi:hypothetical protein
MKKLFASFLLIVGCAKFSSYPDWYITPPNNSNTFLYGSGEGFDPEEARMAALSNVGSRLRTSVASSSASSTDVDNLGRSDSFATRIKANSAKITFTNYEIEKSQYVGKSNSYIALVKVDISKLVGEYSDQIRKKISAINTLINQKNSGVFKEKLSLEKAYKLALEAEEMAGVIKSVDRSHYDQMEVLLGSLASRISSLSKNIYFSIDCNDEKISNMIGEMMLNSGFSVKSSGGVKISCDLVFKSQNSGVSSLIIENLSGKISVIDSTGASVLLKNISKNGSSMMSSEMAKSAAVNALKADIQKAGGLFEFLQ